MCSFSDEYPDYELSELDLFNFEDFCESKYKDSDVQRLGFFKVHLNKDVESGTTIKELTETFCSEVHDSIKELLLICNPVQGCELFGHCSKSASTAAKGNFMKSFKPSSFHKNTIEASCCVQALHEKGTEGFIEHFFASIDKTARQIPKKLQYETEMKTVLDQIPKWQAEHLRRQEFRKQKTVEGMSSLLNSAMEVEQLKEDTRDVPCKCKMCALTNSHMTNHSTNILYSSGIYESVQKHVKITKNFSMMQLCHANMLSLIDSAFNGISFPAMYVGTSHTYFPVHVEDLSLFSWNFLMYGGPKFWIIVPPTSVTKLTVALQASGFGELMSCWNILGHKFYIPSVSWLRKERIPFSVVIQRQGEGIVVLPNAAHSGGNLSFNWSEACNFATKNWLPYGAVSPSCSCIPGSVHPIDLRPAMGVHARHLLGAYLRNDISSAVEDGYFHKSVISYQNIKGLAQSSKGSEDKLTCPLCAYSWCKPLKLRNVKNHVKRHHPKFTQDSRVVQFFKGNFNK